MFRCLLNINLTFIPIFFVSWFINAPVQPSSHCFYRGNDSPTFSGVTPERSQDDQVYDIADKMPRPAGGQDGWEDYLSENLKYPKAALQSKIEGVVYVVFIVEKNGRTSNVQVVRGIGAGCDEEAIRLVEESPKWTPGYNNTEAVRVRMRFPVRFHLP
jgi:TonB family protein